MTKPRFSMSFSAEQVVWLNEILTHCRRTNLVLMRNHAGAAAQKIILTSAQKAAPVSRQQPSEPLGDPPKEKRKPLLPLFCHNGHPFVEQNTRYYKYKGKPRRKCLTCEREYGRRRAEKMRAELERRQEEAWAKMVAEREAKAS